MRARNPAPYVAISALRERDRALIELVAIDGLSVAEVEPYRREASDRGGPAA